MPIRLGTGIGLTRISNTLAVASVSAITSLTILGATPLLDATGDYGDATVRPGINADGWVAKATMPYLVGQTFDPTKITINLSDPGYTTAGAVTTVARTIRGGKILRRQYNAAASQQLSNDGVTLTVYFSLIGDLAEFATVYTGTTLVSASATAGFYGASAAGSISSLINSSTRTYYKAGIICLNEQHDVATVAYRVEYVIAHKHGMNGQQVPYAELVTKDSQATPNTYTTSANTPELSQFFTQGQAPEVFAFTVSLTNLTQADLCFSSIKVYPWIGDSTAVLDIAVTGTNQTGTWAVDDPQVPFRFVCDKTGGYSGANAAVQVGAIGGTVQATRALAELTPFPTYAGALNACRTYNNANKGHDDYGGASIWIMDAAGSPVTHNVATAPASGAGNGLTRVKPSPSNIGLVKMTPTGANRSIGSRIAMHVYYLNTGFVFDGLATPQVVHWNSTTWDQQSVNPMNYRSIGRYANMTHIGTSVQMGGAVFLGYKYETAGEKTISSPAIIGCKFLRMVALTSNGVDGRMCVNNIFNDARASCLDNNGYGPHGSFWVQNVIERCQNGGTDGWRISGDGSTAAIDNAVLVSNTLVGNRLNVAYTDVVGAVSVLKRVDSRFNILRWRNTKTDTFVTNTTATGRCGNWGYLFGVNCWDVVLSGANDGSVTPGTGWLGEYWGNTTYNVGLANVPFISDLSDDTTGVGSGNYDLTGTVNSAYDTTPSGRSPLKYDILGRARYNNGRGCAGAYDTPIASRV